MENHLNLSIKVSVKEEYDGGKSLIREENHKFREVNMK